MKPLLQWGLVGLVIGTMMLGRPQEALGASVTIDPTQGPVGTVVTATGSSWLGNEQIQVLWNSIIQNDFNEVLAETRADANGRFQVNFTIPQTAFLVIQGQAFARTNGFISIWFVSSPARSPRDTTVPFRVTTGPLAPTPTLALPPTPTPTVRANQPPECSIATPVGLQAGQLGELRSTSVDPDGSIASWAWSTTGGSPLRGSASSFQWSAPDGSYEITLTVTDNGGATSSCRVTMVIGAALTPPPSAAGPGLTAVPIVDSVGPVVTIPPPIATFGPTARVGIWVSPAAGDQVTVAPGAERSVLLAARPGTTGATIDKVSFRARWAEVQPAGAWVVLCEAGRGDSEGIFGCQYDFSPIPAREFLLAFDVSDRAGNVTYSPDGERRVTRRFSLSEALRLPVRGAVQVDGFRPTDCDAGRGDHCGLEIYAADLVSDQGAVYPVAPGTAAFAGGTCEIPEFETGLTCLGNTIILSHGEGIYSIYARLDQIARWDGWPRATYDTQMALMGDSGCRGSCTPPTAHLHFSVRRGPEGLASERILWEANQPVNIWELLPELIAAGP